MPADEWLSVTEAATHAKRHEQTVRRALRTGRLQGYQHKECASWRIQREAVDRWLKGQPAEPRRIRVA
ncbi:helix-turn-helix domain-containing protein [Crossiella sp. CA198]|uniref:helix-turn-helix domain-containing protein n=1 Tax=Crossiella sp. CA198 TaxID=3455607 RepID=UPI003F8D5D8D